MKMMHVSKVHVRGGVRGRDRHLPLVVMYGPHELLISIFSLSAPKFDTRKLIAAFSRLFSFIRTTLLRTILRQ